MTRQHQNHETANGISREERSIVHENGAFWVRRNPTQYTVYKQGITHSQADSSYPLTPDGLSIAIARCDYLAKSKASPAANGLSANPTSDRRHTAKSVSLALGMGREVRVHSARQATHDTNTTYRISEVRIRKGVMEGRSFTMGYWFPIKMADKHAYAYALSVLAVDPFINSIPAWDANGGYGNMHTASCIELNDKRARYSCEC